MPERGIESIAADADGKGRHLLATAGVKVEALLRQIEHDALMRRIRQHEALRHQDVIPRLGHPDIHLLIGHAHIVIAHVVLTADVEKGVFLAALYIECPTYDLLIGVVEFEDGGLRG
jgi:hypothetical protein